MYTFELVLILFMISVPIWIQEFQKLIKINYFKKLGDFAWGSITIRPRWEKQIILNTEDFVGGIFYKSI